MTQTLEQPRLAPANRAAAPAPTWLSLETIVFLAVWLLLMTAGRARLFQDPGTFWHTAVGEQMLQSGEMVRRDSFTFTFNGRPWLAHQWLGECLMALGYRLGEWDTLLLATASLLAAVYAWLAHRWQRAGCSTAATVAILSMVFIASAHHYHVRPHLASIVLLAASFGVLCDVESGRVRLSRLLWLIPLFVLWTNLHGGTLGGLATIGIAIAGWTAARLAGLPSPLHSGRDLAFAGSVFLVCLATMFLNPFGGEMPRTWLTIMRLSLPDVIQEHARLDFRRPEAWMAVMLGIVYVVALWRSPQKRVTTLVPLVWLILACDRVRHAPLFAVVAAVAGAELMQRSTEVISVKSLARQRAWLLPGLLVFICLAVQGMGLRIPLIGREWAQLDRRIWPVELIPELNRLQTSPQKRPVFNALHSGGFLNFYAPGASTFIDDRCELFGDAFLHQYVEAEQHRPQEIDAWQRRYGFQHALVQANSPWDSYLAAQPDWRAIAQSPAAVLYQHVAKNNPTIRSSRATSHSSGGVSAMC